MFLAASALVFDTYTKFEPNYSTYIFKFLPILLTYFVSYSLFMRKPINKLLIGVIGAMFFMFYGYFIHAHFYLDIFPKSDLLYFFFVCLCLKTAEKPEKKDVCKSD